MTNTKVPFFNRNFRETVRAKIDELCADGSTITYSGLTEALGFSKDDESIVRELVQRELMGQDDGDVEIVRGRNGGLGLVGTDHQRSSAAKYELEPKFIESVRKKINQTLEVLPRGVSIGMIAGLLGELDSAKVAAAIGQLPEFEAVRGVGVRRKSEDQKDETEGESKGEQSAEAPKATKATPKKKKAA